MSPANNDHLTILLYFYSTLPQVLGAILAITGAFVVFKVDSLKKDLFGSTQWLIDGRHDTENMARQSTVRKYVNALEHSRLTYSQIGNSLDETYEVVDQVLKRTQNDRQPFNFEYLMFVATCEAIIVKKKNIDRYVFRTRLTFIVNGLIVAYLLTCFFVFPSLSIFDGPQQGFVTYILLAKGWIVGLVSLGWIIWYLVSSVGLNRGNRLPMEIFNDLTENRENDQNSSNSDKDQGDGDDL